MVDIRELEEAGRIRDRVPDDARALVLQLDAGSRNNGIGLVGHRSRDSAGDSDLGRGGEGGGENEGEGEQDRATCLHGAPLMVPG